MVQLEEKLEVKLKEDLLMQEGSEHRSSIVKTGKKTSRLDVAVAAGATGLTGHTGSLC